MKLVDAIFWPLALAAVVLMVGFQMSGIAAICLGLALVVSLFQPQSAEGLQKLMVVLTAFSLMGVLSGFQPSWLPWTGLGIFGFLMLTAKL
jgi:hypothetical protein